MTDITALEDVGETYGPWSKAAYFEWEIPLCFLLMETNEAVSFDSPCMTFQDTDFYLRIYPYKPHRADTEGWILIYLQNIEWSCPTRTLNLALGIKKENGTKEICHKTIRESSESFRFLQVSDLLKCKSEMAASDTLTVTCKFWSEDVDFTEGRRYLLVQSTTECDVENFLQLFSRSLPQLTRTAERDSETPRATVHRVLHKTSDLLTENEFSKRSSKKRR